MHILKLSTLSLAISLLLVSCVTIPEHESGHVNTANIQKSKMQVGERTRSYLAYVPANLPPNSPLLFVLHGSLGSGEQMRRLTGYRFERLADQHHFIVIYPDGVGQHWNDCRKKATYSARTQNVDDVGLIRNLAASFKQRYQINPTRVYAMGYSNGGHMAYRLALEAPDVVSGVAVVSANLPTKDNLDCKISDKPVSVMIVNGTADPINPYNGGDVSIFGFGNRGRVLSTAETADWFVNLDHAKSEHLNERLPHPEMGGNLWAERSTWKSSTGYKVVMLTIHGGGHTLPQPNHHSPIFGLTYSGINGSEEIGSFFNLYNASEFSSKNG